jgi:hypothetical protein
MQGGYPDPNYPQGQGYYGYGQQQVQQGQQQLDYSQGQFPQGAYPPQGQPYTGQPQPQMPAGGGAYSAYPETHQMLPNVQTYQTHVEGLSGWNDPPSRKATPTEDPVLKDTESPVTLIVTTLTQTLDMIKNSPVGPLSWVFAPRLLMLTMTLGWRLSGEDDAGHGEAFG